MKSSKSTGGKSSRGRPKILKGDVQNVNLHLPSRWCELMDTYVETSEGRYKTRSDFIREAIRLRFHYEDSYRGSTTAAEVYAGEPQVPFNSAPNEESRKNPVAPLDTKKRA
jgi:Arc/MetJ-type ribon-helix-helix transcriptional regulator